MRRKSCDSGGCKPYGCEDMPEYTSEHEGYRFVPAASTCADHVLHDGVARVAKI